MSTSLSKLSLVIAMFLLSSCGQKLGLASSIPEPTSKASNAPIIISKITTNIENLNTENLKPIAKKIPETKNYYGKNYTDNYLWLNNKNSLEAIKYIRSEKKYTKKVLEANKVSEEKLYNEIIDRTDVFNTSLPKKIDNYYYYQKKEISKSKPIYYRKKDSLFAREELILDSNILSRNDENIKIGTFKVSPDGKILAYSIDKNNSGYFTIYLKNISTGTFLREEISNASGNIEWSNDNKSFYYITLNNDKKTSKVHKHNLGYSTALDRVEYYEKDPSFNLSLSKTDSEAYILITAKNNTTSEIQYIGAKDTRGIFKTFQKRKEGILYDIEHNGGKFFILTNSNAKNFKVMSVNILDQFRNNSWQEVIPTNNSQILKSIQVFKNNLVVLYQEDYKDKIKILNFKKDKINYFDMNEVNYSLKLDDNNDFNTSELRFSYSSLLNPDSIYEYNMDKKKLLLAKKDEVKGYNPYNYQTERIFVKTKDMKSIPLALIYKKGISKDGRAPLLLEVSNNYNFSPERISLLNRGLIIAVADMSQFENNMLDKRFSEQVISLGDYLTGNNYTSRDKIFASAKNKLSLIVASSINKKPELFKAVILDSPILDLINNINNFDLNNDNYGTKKLNINYFNDIKLISPYENISSNNYPNILINTLTNSPEMTESLKYIAKIRSNSKNDNKLVLLLNDEIVNNLELKNIATKYAFILNLLGLKN
ncbi:MAG: S9 family peptidase [Candidatus Sericytochromatia bacterium]|nr:S9 family peptidase [Candidatus Sericytochromatia bacterium]